MQDKSENLGNLPVGINAGEALFRVVFREPDAAALSTVNTAEVLREIGTYTNQVRQMALTLRSEAQRLAWTAASESVLERAAGELLQLESARRQVLAPFLNATDSGAAAPTLCHLRKRLRNVMAVELEAIRDARLCLEFRHAELINQKSGVSMRIVVRGAAQVRLHFGKPADHAAKKD